MKKTDYNDGTGLILRDRSLFHWFFDLLFVVGGVVLIVVSIVMFPSIPAELFGTFVGLLNVVGGLYMFWKEPISEVRFCRTENKVRIRRLGLAGFQEMTLPLDELIDADLELFRHPTGGVFYRPQILFSENRAYPLTMLWRDDYERCMITVQKIKVFLDKT